MMQRVTVLALGLCVSFACSGSGNDTDMGAPSDGDSDAAVADASPGDAAADTGPVDSGTPKAVSVGVGRDSYMAATNGDPVELVAGAQGGGRLEGFHIWSAIRVVGLKSSRIDVTFTITTTTGTQVARQNRIFPALEPNADGFVAYGVAPRISDCCLADRRDIVLAVSATDTDGVTASDEVTLTAGRCNDVLNGQNLCP